MRGLQAGGGSPAHGIGAAQARRAGGKPIHEIHEAAFQSRRLGGTVVRGDSALAGCHPPSTCATRRLHMQWQTPTATNFRFGFEITMYVAAR
jgi:coenzyme PQQ precursor peptide PqqA